MIDLTTAKAHLRVEDGDQDSLIQAYLSSAQKFVQTTTGKLLSPTRTTQKANGFPQRGYSCEVKPVRLLYGPVDAGTAELTIAYDDQAGAEQSLTDFRLVDGSNALILPSYGSQWPCAKQAYGSVRIAYTAGYADGEVPPELDQAVLLLVGHYYQNREAVTGIEVRATPTEMPLAVDELLAPFRAPGIA